MVALLAAVLPRPVVAAVLHVPSDYPTIQAGIDAASPHDSVLVAPGIYYEHISLRADLTLISEGGPASTAIDGGDLETVVTCGAVSNAVLTGFAIRNGRGHSGSGSSGGGIFVSGSSVRISSCDIARCNAEWGGGIYAEYATLTLVGCTVDSTWVHESGAAIFSHQSELSCISCTFAGNHAPWTGGALNQIGSEASFVDCVFVGNTSPTGPAMYVISSGVTSVERCTFVENIGSVAFGGWGAIAFIGSSLSVRQCTFVRNAGFNGSALAGSGVSIENTIIAFGVGGPGVACEAGVSISCSDVYGNEGGDWVGCIAGMEGSSGNVHEDPRFCDINAGDLHLWSDSPCAPPQSGACGLIGAQGVACGPVALEPLTWGSIKALYR